MSLTQRLRETDERIWAPKLAADFGPQLQRRIERDYWRRREILPRREANLWLFDAHQMLKGAPKWIADAHTNEDVDEIARWAAQACGDKHRAIDLDAFTLAHRLPPIPGDTEAGRFARATDWQWWRRQMRVRVFRYRDQLHRHLGYVHRRREVYCSDGAVASQAQRQRANRRLLADLMAVSDTGQTVSLLDVHDGSVANPENRRHEVMTRLRGFEEFGDANDLHAVFVTLTCPSRFHSHYENGRPIRAYDGSTPRVANDHLVKLWSRLRAKLHRKRLLHFGFRIAEPHHDGCPHWHLLLWTTREHRKDLQDVIRRYALADTPTEPGARKHRVRFEWIDRAKGSAVGYVAKYIAKAIDGHGVGEDLFGNPAEAAASRIVAWARTWGIRQFQQIGGPSVTAWREYRRVRPDERGRCPFDPSSPHVVPWMDASMRSDWRAFYQAMGSGRTQRTLLCRDVRLSRLTGECSAPFNRYGERVNPLPVVALWRDNVRLDTHDQFWSVVRRAAAHAWTRVNNCTPPPETGPP